MRALVTGAGGFVGRRMARRLASIGVDVRALMRRSLLAPSDDEESPRIERLRGDITDPAALRRAAAGCDVVFHCAALGGGTLTEARQINVGGTIAMVEAAAAAGVRRMVHLSTMAVHGQKLPLVLTEDAPLRLQGDVYGATKAEGERAALARGAALGLEVVALRPTLVYGPGAPLWVLEYFTRVKTEQVALIDGGRGLANLLFVDDLVDGMWGATTAPVAGEVFLISGASPITWREYLGHFADMCGKPLPPSVPTWRAHLEMQWLRVYGTLAERPRRLRAMDVALMTQRTAVSIDKARHLLGYTPRVDAVEGMHRCATWLQQEGHLPSVPRSAFAARSGRAGYAEAAAAPLATVGA